MQLLQRNLDDTVGLTNPRHTASLTVESERKSLQEKV